MNTKNQCPAHSASPHLFHHNVTPPAHSSQTTDVKDDHANRPYRKTLDAGSIRSSPHPDHPDESFSIRRFISIYSNPPALRQACRISSNDRSSACPAPTPSQTKQAHARSRRTLARSPGPAALLSLVNLRIISSSPYLNPALRRRMYRSALRFRIART